MKEYRQQHGVRNLRVPRLLQDAIRRPRLTQALSSHLVGGGINLTLVFFHGRVGRHGLERRLSSATERGVEAAWPDHGARRTTVTLRCSAGLDERSDLAGALST